MPEASKKQTVVMVGSTARDLPEHREEVPDACLRQAYELVWCDGPPFAYHWGLERELGAGEPEMAAFDESKFEPMPEVEIDPSDEFGAGSVEGAKGEES
jgi:hypothetical protein